MTKRTISEIMSHVETHALPSSASVRDAARLMAEKGVGAVLVKKGEALEGIFTERDALFRVLAEGRDADDTPLAEVMTPNPITVAPEDHLSEGVRLMRDIGFRHLPVVSEEKVVGVVSLRDFIRAAEFAVIAG